MTPKISAHNLDTSVLRKMVPEALKERGYPGYDLSALVEFRYQYVGYHKFWVVRGRQDCKKWFSTKVGCLSNSWTAKGKSRVEVPFPPELHKKLILFAAEQAAICRSREIRYEKERKQAEERRANRKGCMEFLGIDPSKMIGDKITFYHDKAKVSLSFEYTNENMERLRDLAETLAAEHNINLFGGLA